MKTLNELIKETTSVDESRFYSYNVSLLVDGKSVEVTLTLGDVRDAKLVDKWLENELDNSIRFAEGGPNDIELG